MFAINCSYSLKLLFYVLIVFFQKNKKKGIKFIFPCDVKQFLFLKFKHLWFSHGILEEYLNMLSLFFNHIMGFSILFIYLSNLWTMVVGKTR